MFTTIKTADIELKIILFLCCVPQFENLKVYVYEEKKLVCVIYDFRAN